MTADSGTTPSHRLAVLGPVELTGPDGARSPGAARQRRLLTTLAVAAMEGRALSADQLVDAVYGAEAPARARRALATEIWRCRQLLGADAVVGEAEGYRLDPILIEVDLNLFVARMERGRALLDEAAFAAAADELQEALDLWRGAALMDWRDHPDTQAALARLEELRLGASEDLAEALIGSARPAAAVASLQAITQGHPAREHAWALLVEAHLASGDHRKARTTLDTARRTLGEYGVDLGSELRAVRDRVQASADEHAGVADMATPSSEPTVRPPTRPPATPTVAPAPRHPSPALTLPTWLAHPDDIVGRDDELAVVAGILTRALTNAEPSAVVVTGEAGIGKSALLRHAVNTASTPDSDALGAAIGVVHCDRRLSLPYAALTPLLAQFEHQVPGAATLLERGPEGEGEWSDTHELQQRIVDVLEEAATGLGGLLVVAEDLHWATPELVEVLLALLARRARVSIALVVTVRDNEGVSEELAAVLAELRDRALAVVRLSGLDLDQAGRLLGAGPSSAAIVDAHRLTGGNPLYLRQLTVRPDGSVVVPDTLDAVLDARVRSLPERTQRVLEVAAVIGHRFDGRVLTGAVAQAPLEIDPHDVAEALKEAHVSGLVSMVADSRDFTFVHALVRDRLQQRMRSRDRTHAHALVARALSRFSIADPRHEDLLTHHIVAGWPVCTTGEVVERLYAAGAAATRQSAFAEAAQHLLRALDFLVMDPEFPPDVWLGRLLAAAGQAATAAEDLDAARRCMSALHQRGKEQDDPLTALRGALGVVRTYATERVDEPAVDRLAEALDVLLKGPAAGTAEERDLIAESLRALHIYRAAQARTLRTQVVERDPDARTAVLTLLWEQENVPNRLELAAEVAKAPDADPLAAALRLWASRVAAGTGSFAEEPPGIWELPGTAASRWEASLWRATCAMASGQFDRSLRLTDAAEQHVSHSGSAIETAGRTAQLLGQRLIIALQRLDWEEMGRLASANRPVYTARRPIMRTVNALMQIMIGDRAEATRHCDLLGDEFEEGIVPSRDLHSSVIGFANACLWLGHAKGIQIARRELTPWAGEHVLFYVAQYWGSVNFHLGRFAAFDGDLDEAIRYYRLGLDEHRAVGSTTFEARNHWYLAACLWHRDRGRDRAHAVEHHTVAATMAAEQGVPDLANRTWPPESPFHPG